MASPRRPWADADHKRNRARSNGILPRAIPSRLPDRVWANASVLEAPRCRRQEAAWPPWIERVWLRSAYARGIIPDGVGCAARRSRCILAFDCALQKCEFWSRLENHRSFVFCELRPFLFVRPSRLEMAASEERCRLSAGRDGQMENDLFKPVPFANFAKSAVALKS